MSYTPGLEKFGRYCQVTIDFYTSNNIQNYEGTQVYSSPLTIEFDTMQNALQSPNHLNLKIYNLNANDRALLRKNIYTFNKGMMVKVDAGYQNDHAVVFYGLVTEAWSQREGVDFITYIQGFDVGFGYTNAYTNTNFPAGYAKKDIIQEMINSLNTFNVSSGKVSNFPGQINKTTAYSGRTSKLLHQETGGGFFVSNGVAHALLPGDDIGVGTYQISAKTAGLLNTPEYQQSYLDAEILFEPKIQMAQLVQLTSETEAAYNGLYIVQSIRHRAMVSPVVSGDAISRFGLLPQTSNTGVLST